MCLMRRMPPAIRPYTVTTKIFSFGKATTDFPLFNGKVSCEQMSIDSSEVNITCRGSIRKKGVAIKKWVTGAA